MYPIALHPLLFFFSSRRRHTILYRDWSSDVCSSDLSLVACAHADDAVLFVIEHIGAGKFRKDVDAGFFTFLAEPGRQTIQRNDVVAMVHERRWSDRGPNGTRLSEIKKVVLFHRRFQ